VTVAALAVWALTLGAGVYLLSAVMAAKASRRPPTAQDAGASAVTTPVTATSVSSTTTAAGPPPGAGPPPAPRTPPGPRTPPPIPRVKVSSPPGEHPLLQFSHPALGIIGLACWFAFVFTHDHVFAWIAIGVLAVTIGAGLSWLTVQRRDARTHADGNPGPSVPVHRIVLHGLAAATTCGLAIAAILVAGHG
jgi:hypothetical protein